MDSIHFNTNIAIGGGKNVMMMVFIDACTLHTSTLAHIEHGHGGGIQVDARENNESDLSERLLVNYPVKLQINQQIYENKYDFE